jgi:hypothetical protein
LNNPGAGTRRRGFGNDLKIKHILSSGSGPRVIGFWLLAARFWPFFAFLFLSPQHSALIFPETRNLKPNIRGCWLLKVNQQREASGQQQAAKE